MPSIKSQLTAAIKAKAVELGFCKVGIISAEKLKRSNFFQAEALHLKQWLARDYQAGMEWMVTHLEKRLDPKSLMEGTQSIVCVAMNYFTEDAYDTDNPEALKIAKYARGTDYHYVVKDRLKALLAYLQTVDPAIQGRALTDSAPILEKPLAVAAGLGWMAKNGNLLTEDHGSFLFLGELLLNIDLDDEISEHAKLPGCGSCTRCIEACPTEAIIYNETQYGVVDANKCISYWTIEHKGESFPEKISSNLNGWIFGCDICQDVCPWNVKFAQPTSEPLFQARPWNRQPEASEILNLSPEAFRERYQKSPIKRTKLAGLQRNVREAITYPPP